MKAFCLRGVRHEFAPGRGLSGLDLDAEPGEAIALIGPSGAGKTTLLRILNADLVPEHGEVELLATTTKGLWGRPYRHLRRDIGMLYQSDNLVSGLRIFHNLALGRLGHWSSWRALSSRLWPRAGDVAAFEAALSRLELGGRLWDFPEALSGGERQRVAIARLALQAPRLWLADEPATGLDLRLRRQVLDLLLETAQRTEATSVVSVHELELLESAFDRVIALRSGQVVFDGSPGAFTPEIQDEVYGAEARQ